MRIRLLEKKDAPYMLEWMNDVDVIRFLRFSDEKKTLDDAILFIEKSLLSVDTKHFAIVDDKDEYLGTISLKNIDLENKNAEYAICIRKTAMGKNVSKTGTDLILDYAFNELKLNKVYLNVLEDNIRAKRFYQKYGFHYEGIFRKHVLHDDTFKDLEYYSILADEFVK